MENEKPKKKDSTLATILIILVLVSISWGVPSLIRGNNFIHGITENLQALLTIIVIGIIGVGIYKAFLEK